MLKIKDWLYRKNNAQFKPVINVKGCPSVVLRLKDEKTFSLGIIPANLINMEGLKIEKFCDDRIHLEGRVCFADNAISAQVYMVEINSIELKEDKIHSIYFKPVGGLKRNKLC